MLLKPTASRRMMLALSHCDNRQINDAVRRYARSLNDDELVNLLHASRAGLDPYHSAVLESVLHAVDVQHPNGGASIKKMFQTFVAENPRALEQLPARMVDGILQHAASGDAHLRREFTPARTQPYIPVISGMAGSLMAAVAVIAYLHFGARQLNDAVLISPSVALKTAVQRAPALIAKAPRRTGATSPVPRSHPLRALHRANITRHASILVASRPAAASNITLPRTAPRTSIAQSIRHGHSTSAATLLSVVPRPRQNFATVAKAPVAVAESQKTVAVDVNVATVTVESRDAEQSTQETDSNPARYCYARGTWRPC